VKGLLSSLHAPVYRKRLEVLTNLLLPWLEERDSILDVGCGSGQFAAELVETAGRRGLHLNALGLERFPRGNEPIPVTAYEGGRFPFPGASFDMVVVADVLHHEEKPEALLRECVRVSRRFIAIKDHQLWGPLAKARVSLIDWAANAPYGVKCLYDYNTPARWNLILQKFRLAPVAVYPSIDLYPPGFNLLFGRKLQYLAICRVPGAS
jgi:SAM-dependent methyltransferase